MTFLLSSTWKAGNWVIQITREKNDDIFILKPSNHVASFKLHPPIASSHFDTLLHSHASCFVLFDVIWPKVTRFDGLKTAQTSSCSQPELLTQEGMNWEGNLGRQPLSNLRNVRRSTFSLKHGFPTSLVERWISGTFSLRPSKRNDNCCSCWLNKRLRSRFLSIETLLITA